MHCWWDSKSCRHIENSMKFPQKIKNRTNIWCSNSISEFYLGEKKMPILKYICTPKFTTALFYNNQHMESICVHWEMNGQIGVCVCVCVYIYIYICICICIYTYTMGCFTQPQKRHPTICKQHGSRVYYAKLNMSGRERQRFTYVWNLKK